MSIVLKETVHSVVRCIVLFYCILLFHVSSSSWYLKALGVAKSTVLWPGLSIQYPVESMQCDATDLTFQYNSYCSNTQGQLSNKHNGTCRNKNFTSWICVWISPQMNSYSLVCYVWVMCIWISFYLHVLHFILYLYYIS